MPTSTISIVLSTYNRPDVLEKAIRSVLWQTSSDWRLLVIGDNCDDRTAAVIDRLGSSRIVYHNLQARYGEQVAANSLGIATVDSPFIAFLNHDDIWFPDHLETGLSALGAGQLDFYVAGTASARYSAEEGSGVRRPVFDSWSPQRCDLGRVLIEPDFMEPCSAWILRTEFARRIGSWSPTSAVRRTPLQDWVLRAWKSGARIAWATTISVLRILTHGQQCYRTPDGLYKRYSTEHEFIFDLASSSGIGSLRRHVEKDLLNPSTQERPRLTPRALASRARNDLYSGIGRAIYPIARYLYLRKGIDVMVYVRRLMLYRRLNLTRRVNLRTGETLEEPPPLERLLASEGELLRKRLQRLESALPRRRGAAKQQDRQDRQQATETEVEHRQLPLVERPRAVEYSRSGAAGGGASLDEAASCGLGSDPLKPQPKEI